MGRWPRKEKGREGFSLLRENVAFILTIFIPAYVNGKCLLRLERQEFMVVINKKSRRKSCCFRSACGFLAVHAKLCMQSWCIFWSPISNNLFHYSYHRKKGKKNPQSHRKSSQCLFIYCFALEQINGRVCHVDFGGGVIKRARILFLDVRRHKKTNGMF